MADKKEIMQDEAAKSASSMDEVNTVAKADAEDDEESLIIKFKKPYKFEGKEYESIDLSGLEDLTAEDMVALEKQYDRKTPGLNFMSELKVEYAMMMAARAARQPVEFFEQLPAKEAVKVKNRIMGFLFGSD